MNLSNLEYDGKLVGNEYHCGWNCGFFSNCTVSLWHLTYLHSLGVTPSRIDFSAAFMLYKDEDKILDVYPVYFHLDSSVRLAADTKVEHMDHHGTYKNMNHHLFAPFIARYFGLSSELELVKASILAKYTINREKTLVLFYRGTDKVTEIPTVEISYYIEKAREVLKKHPDFRILIQTDEAQFISECFQAFGERCFYVREITVGWAVHLDENLRINRLENGKLFLAITKIMSECHTVVLGTGNVSAWICLFRGNTENIHQLS